MPRQSLHTDIHICSLQDSVLLPSCSRSYSCSRWSSAYLCFSHSVSVNLLINTSSVLPYLQHCLSHTSAESLICTFVFYRLDYCNFFLSLQPFLGVCARKNPGMWSYPNNHSHQYLTFHAKDLQVSYRERTNSLVPTWGTKSYKKSMKGDQSFENSGIAPVTAMMEALRFKCSDKLL